MATINPVVLHLNDDAVQITWPDVNGADTCTPYKGISEYGDRSVQFNGVFNGATGRFEGTNDDLNYETLSDPFGVAITAVSAKLRQVLEFVHAVRPAVSGGDGATAVDVTLVARRFRR